MVFVCFSLLPFSAYSYIYNDDGDRYKCPNGHNATVNRCMGGTADCWVCDANDGWNGWMDPKIEVFYHPDIAIFQEKWSASLGPGRCAWLYGRRFCARSAKPGEPGNNTQHPQLCAYDDPCDPMDPPDGNCFVTMSSPFHEDTTPGDARAKVEEGAMYGAIAGTFLPGIGHGFGAAFGASLAAIQGNLNSEVSATAGCLDRKIGPVPPAFSNNAWFNNSAPTPTFIELANSKFESPKIRVKICKDSTINHSDVLVDCSSSNAVEHSASASPEIILNPKPDNDPTKNYIDCKTTFDNRRFCAKVTTDSPGYVYVYDFEDNIVNMGIVTDSPGMPRPGNMPKPTVSEASGSSQNAVKMNVTLRGQSVMLEEQPGMYQSPPASVPNWNPANSRKFLHQVPLWIERPCINRNAAGVCTQYDNMSCVEGYTTVPGVVANKSDNKAIRGAPNSMLAANTQFDNIYANKEPAIASNGQYLRESFPSDFWRQVGTTSINSSTQVQRPVNAYELGLCVYTPPDGAIVTFDYIGADVEQTYTVPTNCTEVQIKAWGGGAAGSVGVDSGPNGWKLDSSGGAGGYLEDVVGVAQGDTMRIVVAEGGSQKGRDGWQTRVLYKNFWWHANGGKNKFSPNWFGDDTNYRRIRVADSYFNEGPLDYITSTVGNSDSNHSGAQIRRTGDWVGGPNPGVYGYVSQFIKGVAGGKNQTTFQFQSREDCQKRYGAGNASHPNGAPIIGTDNRAPMGAGGCSRDDSGSNDINSYDYGSWGAGGHGRVTVQCTRGRN